MGLGMETVLHSSETVSPILPCWSLELTICGGPFSRTFMCPCRSGKPRTDATHLYTPAVD